MASIKTNHLDNNVIEFVVPESSTVKRLINLVGIAVEAKKTVLLTTSKSIDDFHSWIGKHYAKEKDAEFFNSPLMKDEDDLMLEMLGKVVLDHFIPETYFIKSETDRKVYEIRKVSCDA